MVKRLQLSLHVAFTLIAFAMTGRPPRLVAAARRDLAAVGEQLTTTVDA